MEVLNESGYGSSGIAENLNSNEICPPNHGRTFVRPNLELSSVRLVSCGAESRDDASS
jgi:hypothetical protein